MEPKVIENNLPETESKEVKETNNEETLTKSVESEETSSKNK